MATWDKMNMIDDIPHATAMLWQNLQNYTHDLFYISIVLSKSDLLHVVKDRCCSQAVKPADKTIHELYPHANKHVHSLNKV